MKRNTWQEYQKEVADDNYYYLRSCIRQNFFPGSERAFVRILREELGRNLYDDPAHTSCTGIGYHSDVVLHDTIMTVVARQFALMKEAGYENAAVSCITSFGIYTEVLETWREFPEVEERIREHLYKATGREFYKPRNLAHTSDIIFHHRDAIRQRAKHLLVDHRTGEPLRGVEHIGCHYAKIFPKEGIGGVEFPYVLAGMIEAWGARATPMNLGELYLSLQTKVVDAQENPLTTFDSQKFYEVQDYVILTQHIICPNCIFINENVWQKISPEDQKVIEDAIAEAIVWHDQEIEKAEIELQQELEERGVTIIAPDVESFRSVTAPFIESRFEEKWGVGTWDRIQEM